MAADKAAKAKEFADQDVIRFKVMAEEAAVRAAAEFQAVVNSVVVDEGKSMTKKQMSEHDAAVKSADEFRAIVEKIVVVENDYHNIGVGRNRRASARGGQPQHTPNSHLNHVRPSRLRRSVLLGVGVHNTLKLHVIFCLFGNFAHAVGMGQATISGLGTVLSDKMCIYVH